MRRLPAGWPGILAMWLLPMVVAVAVRRSTTDRLQLFVAVIAAVAVIAVASRWPVGALCGLFFFFPLRDVVFSTLFRLGVSASIVRQGGLWKEVVVAALVVAAFRRLRSERGAMAPQDRLALAVVGIALVYFLAPGVVRTSTVPYDARIGSLRSEAGFAVLFLACRRLAIGDRDKDRLIAAIVGAALVLAASGLWQFISPAGFAHFMITTIRLPLYKRVVLNSPFNVATITLASRPGGFLVDAPLLAEALILPLAIASNRVVRPGANPSWYVAAALFATAILITASRGAALAAVLVLLLTLRRTGAAHAATRLRYALALMATAVIVAPFFLHTQLAHRAKAAVAGSDVSARSHGSQLTNSTRIFFSHPLGLGLGIGTASRTAPTQAYISEDAYLQIGNEIGALPMVLFVALVVTTLSAVRARGDTAERSPLADAAFCAGVAIGVISLFTNAWIDVNLSWVFWSVAGVVLADRPRSSGETPVAIGGLPSRLSALPPRMPTRSRMG